MISLDIAFAFRFLCLIKLLTFVTVRNSSCGKIIFSQACIIPSVHSGGGLCGEVGCVWQRGGICGKGACMAKGGMHGRGHVWWGHVCQGVCAGGGMCAEEMATEVGGIHPTGMHSC